MFRNSVKVALALTGALMPFTLVGVQQAIASHLSFRFHNNTSVSVERLFVSPSSSPNWEEDVLGSRILPSGRSIYINIPGDYDTCYFDIKAQFRDGSSIHRRGFNLCRTSDIYLP
jgi:hypothetical protein